MTVRGWDFSQYERTRIRLMESSMNSYRHLLVFLFFSIFFSIFFSLSAVVVHGESTEIREISWNTHYGVAKRSAEQTQRPLLVVIENPDNTDTKIDESKLDSKSREELRRQKFEIVRVDATTKYGELVAKAFGVERFPYTAVTDNGSKKIVFRKSGPMSKSDWMLAFAKSDASRNVQTNVNVDLFSPNGAFQFPAQQCFT